ncbi:WGR domain-containing protein [Sinirhodobacter populi]|uniref:WGR domain-containing protein n=1 Tax=Paenirhodobacter populi TaxID=2306993 RepID=A0A443KCC8_9RHOB|nr:WGR domain-containing protein [Sinirhodobacter populi]
MLLYYENDKTNALRFYNVSIETDLFNEPVVVRNWGRKGTHGKVKRVVCKSHGEAITAMEVLVGRKIRKGYKGFG